MRSPAHVLAVRAVLLGALLASGGCFRPKIKSGGFACSHSGTCPDDFQCDPRTNLCVNTAVDAGAGGGGGQGGGGQGGMDAGAIDMGGADHPCLDPIASCQPSDAGLCDPVCNTGCGQCFQKCSVNSTGDLTCNAPTGAFGLLQICEQTGFGAVQTDNCQPGEACITANSCGARCYQFCRANSDCANGASCSVDAGGGATFCDVPPVVCDPVNGVARSSSSGCPAPTSCYLSATAPTTVCDCENNRTTGSGVNGDRCTRSRDCFAGLVCIDPTGIRGYKTCYKVCRLPNADGGVAAQAGEAGCIGASNCTQIALPDGTTNPTYGFCNE